MLFPHWNVLLISGRAKTIQPVEWAMLKDRRILVVIQRRSAAADPTAADLDRDGLTASVTDLSKLDRTLRRTRCARNSREVRVTGSHAPVLTALHGSARGTDRPFAALQRFRPLYAVLLPRRGASRHAYY